MSVHVFDLVFAFALEPDSQTELPSEVSGFFRKITEGLSAERGVLSDGKFQSGRHVKEGPTKVCLASDSTGRHVIEVEERGYRRSGIRQIMGQNNNRRRTNGDAVGRWDLIF